MNCDRCGKEMFFEKWLYPNEDDELQGHWQCVCGDWKPAYDTSNQKEISVKGE